MDSVIQFIISTGLLGGLLACSVYLLKQSLEKKLTLELESRLNSQKAELEKIRDNFLYQIHKDKVTAEIKIQKSHEIYPEFYEKLLLAIGHTESLLGFTFELSFEEFSEADIEKYLVSKNIVSGQVEKLVGSIKTDRKKGISEMRSYLNIIKHNEAERAYQQVHAYLANRSLYMSEPIYNESRALCDMILSANVFSRPEIQNAEYAKKYFKEIEKIKLALPKLKQNLANELSPKL